MRLRNKKTGEIADFGNLQVYVEAENTDRSQLLGNFNSIEQILEYYEDYIPTEPLIENEKVRKILRDWAKLNNIGSVVILDAKSHIIVRSRIGISYDLEFNYDYKADFKNIEFGESYAIEELCGEEEEPEDDDEEEDMMDEEYC